MMRPAEKGNGFGLVSRLGHPGQLKLALVDKLGNLHMQLFRIYLLSEALRLNMPVYHYDLTAYGITLS